MNNILVTGAGSPGGPGIILALNQNYNVHGADTDPQATGAPLCQQFHQVPPAQHPQFISQVLQLCTLHNIQVVVPLVTKELEVFAAHIPQFEAINCKVIVNPPAVLNLCNDKHLLLLKMKEIGLAIPKFYAHTELNLLLEAIEILGYPKNAVCIKPAHSNGMRGFRIFDPNVKKADQFWLQKPSSVYMEPQELGHFLPQTFPTLLAMEYLPGPEYTVDCIAHHGQALLVLPRLRTRMNNGISVKGQFENSPEIIDYCHEVINKLNLHGPIGIQLKNDTIGQPKMLEINPRLQGTTVAAAGMGFNIPALVVEQALGNTPDINSQNLPWGTHFGRYYTEVFW